MTIIMQQLSGVVKSMSNQSQAAPQQHHNPPAHTHGFSAITGDYGGPPAPHAQSQGFLEDTSFELEYSYNF